MAIDSREEHYCPCCQLRLSRLIDSSGLNTSYYCNHCSIEVIPSLTEVRSASKLVTPEGPVESPSVSYPPEIKGGLAELKKRGIRITSYKEGKG